MDSEVIVFSGGGAVGLLSILEGEGLAATHTRTMSRTVERVRAGHAECVVIDRDVTADDALETILNVREFVPDLPVVIVTGVWQAMDHAISMLPDVTFVNPSETAVRQAFGRLVPALSRQASAGMAGEEAAEGW